MDVNFLILDSRYYFNFTYSSLEESDPNLMDLVIDLEATDKIKPNPDLQLYAITGEQYPNLTKMHQKIKNREDLNINVNIINARTIKTSMPNLFMEKYMNFGTSVLKYCEVKLNYIVNIFNDGIKSFPEENRMITREEAFSDFVATGLSAMGRRRRAASIQNDLRNKFLTSRSPISLEMFNKIMAQYDVLAYFENGKLHKENGPAFLTRTMHRYYLEGVLQKSEKLNTGVIIPI